MALNMDNAVTLLARIEIESINDRWNQDVWGLIVDPPLDQNREVIVDDLTGLPLGFGSCGTGMCAAGWACTIAGLRPVWEHGGGGEFETNNVRDGRRIPVAAAAWLGIDWLSESEEEFFTTGVGGRVDDPRWNNNLNAPALFAAGNRIGDLYRHMASWMDEPDEVALRVAVEARIEEMQKEAVARQK